MIKNDPKNHLNKEFDLTIIENDQSLTMFSCNVSITQSNGLQTQLEV
jgi:hypothetical protein